MKRFVLFMVGLLCSAVALANTADGISVENPYVRLVPHNAQATGAFMVIRNNGAAKIKIMGAESSLSRVTELHTHINEGGVMKMRPVPFIEIPAQGEAVLQPGGMHVMLIGLQEVLQEGAWVEITLVFEDGSRKLVKAEVRSPVRHLVKPAH